MFKTILVPHDGYAMSDKSDKALDKAVENAKFVKGSKLVIIYVIPEITPILRYGHKRQM